ncbi:hypothetical protein GOC37_22750 [Sinorhizobium meliloti]|nr:hypothetical protein [Sinorhizobium meliloti]
MTEDIGMEAAADLDAKMERHLVAQRAVADAVREWDERRAAGDVTEVVYGSLVLPETHAGAPGSTGTGELRS